jgi:uncharacterized GH25 family protein
MQDTPIKQTLAALALAALSLQASAHRPWLLPTATLVESRDAWVTIDGAISENFFEFDHMPLKLDGIVIAGPDGAPVTVPAVTMGKLRSSFDLKLDKPGTYKVALVTNTVMASYKAGDEVKRFRGSEEAFAKEVPANAPELKTSYQQARLETFVTNLKPSDGALKASGHGLELVPVTHPNELRAGETAKWRFQLDGKALPNFAFSLVPGGVRYRGVLGEIRLVTDAKGEAAVTLPDAGMYWLNANYPEAGAKGPGEPGSRRYSYAATLEILMP